MQYRVKILKPDTGVGFTTVQAASLSDARAQMTAQGHAVLSVGLAPFSTRLFSANSARFPLLLFSQELLSLIDSGISMVEALETLIEKEAHPGTREVIANIVKALRNGQTLSSALEDAPQAFPPLYVATVRASERTSGLEEALGRYIVYANQLEILRGRLVSAAIYPILLICVSSLVILFLMAYVVPRFSHIYEDMGGNLPFLSRLLLDWGLWIEKSWPLVIGLGVVLLVTIAYGGIRPIKQRLIRWLWRVPAAGERMRIFQLTRLYRTLGMLQRGGIAIVPALEMVSGLLSPALQERLAQATQSIRAGHPISHAFEINGLTSAVALRMLRVGERAGNMGEMLERMAAFHDEEMARWAEWVTRLLGPVLMLIMGLVIGAMVVLMYLPIFQLAESIQ